MPNITDIFNLSLTIEAMDVHICNEKGCKGSEYGGLNITCGVCLLPYYYQCLSQRDEFVHFLDQMKIGKIKEDDQQTLNATHIKVNTLFGATSVFEFICPSCKGSLNNVTFYDIKHNLETKIDVLKSDYDKLKDEIKGLKSKNSKLNTEVTTIKAKLYDQSTGTQQSQQTISNVHDYVSELTLLRSQIDGKANEIEAFSEELKVSLATQQSRLEEFKVESENVMKHAIDLLDKLTSKVPNVEDIHEVNGESDSNSKPSQSNQDNHPVTGFQGENYGQKSSSEIHVFNKPSNVSSLRDSGENDYNTVLYELHISPFEINVESKEIVKHILDYTPVKDSKLFSVQRLGGQDARRTFISFKVSTLDRNVYNAVFSDKLWSNQTIRPFKNSSPNSHQKTNNIYDENHRSNSNFRNPFSQNYNRPQFQHQNLSKPYIPRFNEQQQQPRRKYNENTNDARNFENSGSSNLNGFQRDSNNYQQRYNRNDQGESNENYVSRDNFLIQNQSREQTRYNPFRQYNNKRQ